VFLFIRISILNIKTISGWWSSTRVS